MTLEYYCKSCDQDCRYNADFVRHNKTKKHERNIFTKQNNKILLECKVCDYNCGKQSILHKHLLTKKHKSLVKMNSHDNVSYFIQPSDNFDISSSHTGTFLKCSEISADDYKNEIIQLKQFIIEQTNEHKRDTSEIITKIFEMARETTEIVNKAMDIAKTSTTTITNNKAFNINLFLNEQCKDAMNFSDFINNLVVSHEDLENNAQLGFVGGISKIILDGLKDMNQNERPIHCTDVKRETMYIKDDNKWNKEENDDKLRSAIQAVTRKSLGTLQHWKQDNPDYKNLNSEFSNRCITIQRSSVAGSDREVYYPKVIHAIAREVLVNK